MRKKRLCTSNTEPDSQPSNSHSFFQPDNGSQAPLQHGSSQPHIANQGSSLDISRNSSHAPSRNSSRAQEEEDIFHDELLSEFEVRMTDGSTTRNKRGITRLADIWNLPSGRKIIVEFNAILLPVGVEGGVFNRFLGTIARKPHLCPINCNNWHHVPNHYKEDCWKIVESKFVIPEGERVRHEIKRNTLKSIGEKLREWRCSLKSQYYDASKTAAQTVAAAPARVNREHYAELVNYWYTYDAKFLSEANKKHRADQKDQHTAGSKTYSQHARTMEENAKVAVNRTTLYIQTHTRKDKTAVNEIAAENMRKMEDLMKSQTPSSEENIMGKIGWASGDIYSQVIGKKERHGRVRGLGFGYTPKNCGTSSSNDTRFRVDSDEDRMKDREIINELQNKLQTQDHVLNSQADELNTLRAQVDFLLKQSGVQVQHIASDTCDQASPQMHQVPSFVSHEIEPSHLGNRTI